MWGAAAFGRLCVETFLIICGLSYEFAAAFGRLCVETTDYAAEADNEHAAAFGRLCVETDEDKLREEQGGTQPPSGGCVLKRYLEKVAAGTISQPPSGGCVLKLGKRKPITVIAKAAAFGRLCVETHR